MIASRPEEISTRDFPNIVLRRSMPDNHWSYQHSVDLCTAVSERPHKHARTRIRAIVPPASNGRRLHRTRQADTGLHPASDPIGAAGKAAGVLQLSPC
jgi:hypothetical protein